MTAGQRTVIHTVKEISGIRKAAQATAWVRDNLERSIKPGMTTLEIDQLAAIYIKETGGTSAFYNYRGFPGQICISLDDVVVHGIGRPNVVVLPGQLVSIDVGVTLDRYIGDSAVSFFAGGLVPSEEGQRLLAVTQKSLIAGIESAVAGGFVNDISKAVENVVRHAGFEVVRDFVGHGCGCHLHEPPEVPNFSQRHKGPKLTAGMVLAIEPMVNIGTSEVIVADDGWTVHTADGKLSAHFEHMVLITKEGPEILTWAKTQ